MTRLAIAILFLVEGCSGKERWWCSAEICTRAEKECLDMSPVDSNCSKNRIAFCPLDGKILQCTPTLELCEGRAKKLDDDPYARCAGVE